MQTKITPQIRRYWAEKLGASEPYLYQCLTGRREMAPAEARRIEEQSGGAITRQMLCHKTWQGIWPELAQSPVTIAQQAIETVAVEPVNTVSSGALRGGVVRRHLDPRRVQDMLSTVDRRAKKGPPFQGTDSGVA